MDETNILVGEEVEKSLLDTSVSELLLLLLKTHDKNIIQVDGSTNEELRANWLLSRAIEVSKWLRNEGIKVGDCISINCRNRLEYGVISVAILLIGATVAPLNPDYTEGELKHVLSLFKPKLIFCSLDTISKMFKILPDHPYIKKLIHLDSKTVNHPSIVSYELIIAGANGEVDEAFEATSVDPNETIATILCSSGTTGLPKGVMCAQSSILIFLDIARVIYAHMVANDDPSDALLGLSPFFHSMGFMLMFLNIMRGKCMVLLSKFQTKWLLDAIINYKITRLIVPPPVITIILRHPLAKKYDLSKIREIRTGAAPMGKDMERELKERFNIEHVSQNYGMTETTLSVLNSPFNKTKFGSVGQIMPEMKAKVIENGIALGPYKRGELCLKGPLIMKGYIGDVEATRNAIDEHNWLHTGDVAYYDDEGYFYIVDRIKELIKYKGFQVAPAELEALLMTHSKVKDAAVVGLPNEDAGELPLAFVVKNPSSNVTAAEIEKFVADNMSHQKQLRGGVIFVEEIPRNPSGKILRRVLRDQAIKMKSKL